MFCRGFGVGPGFRFGMGAWGGAGWLGMILHAAIIIGIVYLVYRLIKRLTETTHSNGNNALKILEEEYALGKITREEFLEKRQVLKNN